MNIRDVAVAKSIINKIITRDEFLSMINTNNIESAVKAIIEKPIGTKLYEAVRTGSRDPVYLSKAIDEYNAERLSYLKEKLSLHGKLVVETFDDLFDSLNIALTYLNLQYKGSPSRLFPIGILYKISGIEDVSSIDELKNLVTGNMRKAIDLIAMKNIKGYDVLLYTLTHLPYKHIKSPRTKKLFGFIHDAYCIKTCVFSSGEPSIIPWLLTISRNDFIEICKANTLDELMRNLSSINPLYKEFSEVLTDIAKIYYFPESFDLGIFLYSAHQTRDLIFNYEDIISRAYVLSVTESVLLKMVLLTVYYNANIEETKRIINKWWVL